METGASPGDETGTGAPYTGLVDLGGPFGGLRASGVKMTFLVGKRLIFSGIFPFLLSECLAGTGAPSGYTSGTGAPPGDLAGTSSSCWYLRGMGDPCGEVPTLIHSS